MDDPPATESAMLHCHVCTAAQNGKTKHGCFGVFMFLAVTWRGVTWDENTARGATKPQILDLQVLDWIGVNASEMSLAPTNTSKTTLHSAPHTQVTYVSELISAKLREKESRLRDNQGEAVLLSKQSTPINSGRFCLPPLPQNPSFLRSRPFILSSRPLSPPPPSVTAHTIHNNWCSQPMSPISSQDSFLSYMRISTFQ